MFWLSCANATGGYFDIVLLLSFWRWLLPIFDPSAQRQIAAIATNTCSLAIVQTVASTKLGQDEKAAVAQVINSRTTQAATSSWKNYTFFRGLHVEEPNFRSNAGNKYLPHMCAIPNWKLPSTIFLFRKTFSAHWSYLFLFSLLLLVGFWQMPERTDRFSIAMKILACCFLAHKYRQMDTMTLWRVAVFSRKLRWHKLLGSPCNKMRSFIFL